MFLTNHGTIYRRHDMAHIQNITLLIILLVTKPSVYDMLIVVTPPVLYYILHANYSLKKSM